MLKNEAVYLSMGSKTKIMRMDREIKQLRLLGDLLAFDVAMQVARLARASSSLTLDLFRIQDVIEIEAGIVSDVKKIGVPVNLIEKSVDSPIYDR